MAGFTGKNESFKLKAMMIAVRLATAICLIQVLIFVSGYASERSPFEQILAYSVASIIVLSVEFLPPRAAMAGRMGLLILVFLKALSVTTSVGTSAAANGAYGQSYLQNMYIHKCTLLKHI